jgi:hypothetical protein
MELMGCHLLLQCRHETNLLVAQDHLAMIIASSPNQQSAMIACCGMFVL